MKVETIIRVVFWVLVFCCTLLPLLQLFLAPPKFVSDAVRGFIGYLPVLAPIPLLLLCTFLGRQLGVLQTAGLLLVMAWYVILLWTSQR